MANNYESLKTDGHYTMARRIFMKIKGWAEPKSVVCTQAQYDDLPSTKNTDGKTYYVYDATVSTNLLVDLFYPVGSYYETDDTTFNPNLMWVGTWVLESGGLVHVSSGTNYSVSANAQDGGTETVTLDTNQIPSHNHGPRIPLNESGYGVQIGPWGVYIRNFSGTPQLVDTGNNVLRNLNARSIIESNIGGGQAHNNMQPYKVVNRWHRTA